MSLGNVRLEIQWPSALSRVIETSLPGDDRPFDKPAPIIEAEARRATARWSRYYQRLLTDPDAEIEE